MSWLTLVRPTLATAAVPVSRARLRAAGTASAVIRADRALVKARNARMGDITFSGSCQSRPHPVSPSRGGRSGGEVADAFDEADPVGVGLGERRHVEGGDPRLLQRGQALGDITFRADQRGACQQLARD